MRAHLSCRPALTSHDETAGCFLVCPEHGMHQSFGFSHRSALAACREHNLVAHA